MTTTQDKKKKIKLLVIDMLKESHDVMIKNIDKVLNSGCIDVDSWDEENAPMIMPKCIVSAIILRESTQYDDKGTTYEKRIKKEVNNIRNFI